MYAVTDAYTTALAAQIRDPCSVKLDILRLDGKAQAALAAGLSAGCLSGCEEEKTVDLTAFPRPVASFEQDWLAVDGSQVFLEDAAPCYYISSALSDATADYTGRYPIDGEILTVSLDAGFPAGSTVTWAFDSRARPYGLSWYVNGTLTASAVLDTEQARFTIPSGQTVTSVGIRATRMYQPNTRLRLLKVYAGTADSYTGRELLSLKFTDINDGIGLGLPERKLTVSLRNTAGLTTESEYLSPTYRETDTQAVLQIGMGVGGAVVPIPMGRFFLSEYQVDEDSIDFTFQDALGLLSESTHYWAAPCSYADPDLVSDCITQVLKPTGIRGSGSAIPLPSAGRDYNLSLYNAGRNLSKKVYAPCSRVSCADALRLYASFSGNLIRGGREVDLELLDYTQSYSRTLTRYEMLQRPKWEVSDAVSSIEVEKRVRKYGGDASEKELASGSFVSGDTYTVYCDDEIGILYYEDGEYLAPLESKAIIVYGTIYARQFIMRTDYTGKIMAHINEYDTVVETYTPAGAVQGESKTLSNPIVGIDYGDDAGQAMDYAAMLYDELQYPLTATLTHRGFPELDAGDIISLSVEDGASVAVRVLENTVEIKSGAMSGTTKVRRLQ